MANELKPMDPEWLDQVRRGLDTRHVAVDALLAAHDYWRERVSVDVCDLEREGVGLAKVAAWMEANGWSRRPWDGSQLDGWTKAGALSSWIDTPRDGKDVGGVAASVRFIGEITGRSQWDILAEMAAMEVSNG